MKIFKTGCVRRGAPIWGDGREKGLACLVTENSYEDIISVMYVCMYSRVWINRVRLPILLVVS